MKKSQAIWATVLTTVATMVTLAILVAVEFMGGQLGTRMELECGEIYYTGNVTQIEAEQLGRFLSEISKDSAVQGTWQLDRDGKDLVVRMCTQPEAYTNSDFDAEFIAMESTLQSQVFDLCNVRVELTNDLLETQKVFDQFEFQWVNDSIPFSVRQLLK